MSQDLVFDTVRRHILDVLPDLDPAQVTLDQSLVALGANSVDRVEIVTMSMESLNVTIPLVSFAQVRNIAGLVDVLNANLR
ncbi:MAG: acyl carrier protein [Burkholderia sp.]